MQSIRTRHFGPSNVKGSRIQAKCEARTIYVAYDHALNLDQNHRAACRALLLAMNWTAEHGRYSPMVGGFFARDMYWVFQTDISTGAAAPDMLAALQNIYANAAESPEYIRARIADVIAAATGAE
jgi:hypothetical protein